MKKITLVVSVFLFSFSFFSQSQPYQTNGSCVQVTPRTFRLTDSTTGQGGNFFATTQINLNNPFDLTFFINLGCINNNGADGIAFLFHNSVYGAGALGGNGGGMGYTSTSIITPSLAVEFDTNPNTFEGWPDPAYDHIAIIKDGDLTVNQAGPVQISATQANVEDCVCHTGRIQWTPSLNRLRIYFDGVLRLSYNNNIIANYFAGNPNVYWGFGGGTGVYYNIQTVSIDFANAGNNLSVCQGSGVQLNGTGGTTYAWSPSTGLSNSTIANPIASPTVNTTYTLTATNSSGCTDTSIVKVLVNAMPIVNAGGDKFICPGTSTTLSGTGTGSTYLWSPSTGLNNNTSLTPTASPTATTTYTIVASSALGCTVSDVVVVNVYATPNANAGASQSVCAGNSVQLNASGGLSYSWSPSTGLSNTTISNPTATVSMNTTFTVTVTDDHSCLASDTVSVHILSAPIANAGIDMMKCSNNAVTLNGSGGISYSWSPVSGLSNATISNPICFSASTTTYTLTVINAVGCSSSDQIVVTVYPPTIPPDIIPIQPTICAGSAVTITANGSINYSWFPSTGLNTTSGAVVVASPTITTNYTVAGTDINGCVASRFFSVIVNGIPAIASESITDAQCPGTGAIDIGMNLGVYSFLWNTGLTAEDISGLNAGTYVVTVTGNGCSSVNSFIVAQALLAKPQNLLVSNLTSCSARLNWSSVANMSYYKVRFRQTGTTTWSVAVNVGSNLFYDFAGLNPAINYQFQVSAYCASNATGGWMTKTATTKVCTTPASITVTIINSTSVSVSWSALCASNSFQLIYKKVGTTQWQQVNTALTSATLINLLASTTYEFKIKAICSGGSSTFSSLQNFTTPVVRNEYVADNLFSMMVFPNPTFGIINVELLFPVNNFSIELTNVLGEILWRNETSDTNMNIDLSNKAAGIYFLVYRDENRVETKRVIVER